MAYVCNLGSGQRLYISHQGTQTTLTIASSNPGQQQQSSTSFETGSWTSPPSVSRAANRVVIRLRSKQGDRFIHIQGNSLSMTDEAPILENSEPLLVQQDVSAPANPELTMPPMEPMAPLKMGDMQMSLNPMEMRMGNMEMRMPPIASSVPVATRRFCSECGGAVKPSDRFCSSCGSPLSSNSSET